MNSDVRCQDLSSRLASVKSLSAFKSLLLAPKVSCKSKPQFLDVYFAVYDTLLDDDEDVRSEGSSIISYILSESTGGIQLKPLVAATRLLEFLCSTYADSKHLYIKATARMIGAEVRDFEGRNPVNGALHCEPVSTLLSAAREEDHSLFVEEKQNLYRDDVQEAQRMAQLLLSLKPAALDPHVAYFLRDWTLAGLKILIENTKAEGQDGPLGWTSKPEVYTLGMRVIVAAKVVITWDLSGEREREVERMVDSIKEFLEVGKSGEVHGLWIREAEMVLEVVKEKEI